MALEFKAGVSLKGIQPQTVLAIQLVEQEFDVYRLTAVVTSVNDGKHSEKSLHYKGLAADFRTKHAPGIMKGIFLSIFKRLNPLGYDVIWEDQGEENEHLHVEYQPKD